MANLVIKQNTLINASYRLNLIEQRLILLAIMRARETNTGITANDPLTVSAQSYMNHFNVTKEASYQALKEACENLFERKFSGENLTSNNKIERITSRWVSQISYIDDTAQIKLIFAPAVVPLITQLESHFTSYDIKQVAQLRSAYAVRLYELLIAWRSTGKTPIFKLEDLRNKLGVNPDEYKVLAKFKRDVLDFSIDQINQHTDISAKYEQHKTGRVITGFTFTFKQIKEKSAIVSKRPKLDNAYIDANASIAKEETHPDYILGIIELGIDEQTAKRWQRKYAADRIIAALAYTKHMQASGKIRDSVCGFLTRSIADNTGTGWVTENNNKVSAKTKAFNEQVDQKHAEEQRRAAEDAERKYYIDLFESHDDDIRYEVLEHMEGLINDKNISYISSSFKEKRPIGTVHKSPMFSKYLKESLVAVLGADCLY